MTTFSVSKRIRPKRSFRIDADFQPDVRLFRNGFMLKKKKIKTDVKRLEAIFSGRATDDGCVEIFAGLKIGECITITLEQGLTTTASDFFSEKAVKNTRKIWSGYFLHG